MFYEVIYETGRSSVAYYADDAEAESALAEQHRRAVAGEPGGPLGVPAERIKNVYVYKQHPNEFNPEQTMSVDVVKENLANAADMLADDNGVVPIDRLAVEIRAMTHPMVITKESSFDSNFRMEEDRKLDTKFLGAVEK